MSLEEEVELIEYLYELLSTNFEQELRILESGDPYDSPVIVFRYNERNYAIAVEEFPPRENFFREEE